MTLVRARRLLTLVLLLGAVSSNAGAQNAARPTLKPGDLVRLWIWREDDWSGEFPVPEGGVVTFPRIGERKVVGIPIETLRDSLIAAYRVYLQTPSIEITFRHRVNILGAVRQPGLYHVDRTMTIQDAVALAGGVERDGKPDEVQLFREGERLQQKVTRRTRISDLALESGDLIYVPQRSWLTRSGTVIASALASGLITLAVTLAAK